MVGVPRWMWELMVQHGAHRSVHERDGSIIGDEPLRSNLETTTSEDPRAKGVVSLGYKERYEEYKPPYQTL